MENQIIIQYTFNGITYKLSLDEFIEMNEFWRNRSNMVLSRIKPLVISKSNGWKGITTDKDTINYYL